jgi:hypothetical protein
MQKPGFCRKLLDRHCLKKTGFLKICATDGSLGISRLAAYPFFKIGSNSRRKSVQAAADAELETAP